MSELMEQAFEKLIEAGPRQGLFPTTEEEWQRSQEAMKFISVALYIEAGLSPHEANKLAEYAYGGPEGRQLTEMCYRFLIGKNHGSNG